MSSLLSSCLHLGSLTCQSRIRDVLSKKHCGRLQKGHSVAKTNMTMYIAQLIFLLFIKLLGQVSIRYNQALIILTSELLRDLPVGEPSFFSNLSSRGTLD